MLKRILLPLFILVVLAAAFFLLPFRVMKSTTTANSTVAASRTSNDQPVQISSPVGLYVSGDAVLARRIMAQLQSESSRVPQLQSFNLLSAAADQADTPLMIVTLKENQVRWTPFFARAALQVTVSYATNGDVSFRHTDPTHFQSDSGQPPSLRYQGKYVLADQSYGLLSLPGYQDYLAGKVVDAILSSATAQMENLAAK